VRTIGLQCPNSYICSLRGKGNGAGMDVSMLMIATSVLKWQTGTFWGHDMKGWYILYASVFYTSSQLILLAKM